MSAGRRDGGNLEHGITAMSSHGWNGEIGSTGYCNWVGASVEGVKFFMYIPSPSRTGKGFHVGRPMDMCSVSRVFEQCSYLDTVRVTSSKRTERRRWARPD